MKLLCVILGFLALPVAHVNAANTPEEMIVIYFDAFKQGDVNTLADQMHVGELAKFQQTLMPLIQKSMEKDPVGASRDAAAIRQLVGEDSMATLRNETPQAFFARFMSWMIKLNPMIVSSLAGATIQPLGYVAENDMAHVTYRINLNMMGAKISQLKIMSVKKQDDAWRLMMPGEVEGLGKLLESNSRP